MPDDIGLDDQDLVAYEFANFVIDEFRKQAASRDIAMVIITADKRKGRIVPAMSAVGLSEDGVKALVHAAHHYLNEVGAMTAERIDVGGDA